MKLNDLKVLARNCDTKLEELATARKWGTAAHVAKAQQNLDEAFKAYDDGEKVYDIEHQKKG